MRLDRNFRVSKFTPAATKLFHLIAGDVGRPIADFAQRFDGEDLVSHAHEVLRRLVPFERQVRGPESSWFILRTSTRRRACERSWNS